MGLAIVQTTIQLPFSVCIMRNSFDAVSRELEEAAVIYGLLDPAGSVPNPHSSGAMAIVTARFSLSSRRGTNSAAR